MPGAVRAFGTQILCRPKPTGSPDPWIVLGGVKDIEGPQRAREAIDVTTHDSPDNYTEKLGGIKDGGPVSFDIELYAATNTAASPQIAGIETAFETGVIYEYCVMLAGGECVGFGTPAGTEYDKCWTFFGFISRIGQALPVKESARQSIEITITGKVTWHIAGA